MAEYIVPRIQQLYDYQGNHLQCWASVALTMWRWKHGRGGVGNTTEELFSRSGGAPFADVINFSTEVSVEMYDNQSSLDAAAAAVRRRMPQYNNTPTGLPSGSADRLFTWLGCSSSPIIPATTPEQLRNLIRSKGPLAIFTRNPGHLQIIVGWWETDPAQPQMILFNPERYILQMAATRNPQLATSAVREDRWLWPHWQAYFAGNLIGAKAWHF